MYSKLSVSREIWSGRAKITTFVTLQACRHREVARPASGFTPDGH